MVILVVSRHFCPWKGQSRDITRLTTDTAARVLYSWLFIPLVEQEKWDGRERREYDADGYSRRPVINPLVCHWRLSPRSTGGSLPHYPRSIPLVPLRGDISTPSRRSRYRLAVHSRRLQKHCRFTSRDSLLFQCYPQGIYRANLSNERARARARTQVCTPYAFVRLLPRLECTTELIRDQWAWVCVRVFVEISQKRTTKSRMIPKFTRKKSQ